VIKSPQAGKKKFAPEVKDSVGLKLFVSNLDWGVTKKDLLELFGEYGHLKSFNVHYNAAGKSQGTADVVFKNRSEALKAMKMYNGRTLDGRVMQIQALNDVTSATATNKKVLSSGKVLGSKSPAGGARGRGRGRRGGSNAMDMS
jgi:THO complex subunit 4